MEARSAGGASGRVDPTRGQVSARLSARRADLEAVIQLRVSAVSSVGDVRDPLYVEGIGEAVAAAVDYGLAALDAGLDRPLPIPDQLLLQARRAARNGVSLDTVLRRYFAGYSQFCDLLLEEAAKEELPKGFLRRIFEERALLFDSLLSSVSEEYSREQAAAQRPSPSRIKAERVRRLLAGNGAATGLAYDMSGWHIGVCAIGGGAGDACRDVARRLDRELLAVQQDGDLLWAWFRGSRRPRIAQFSMAMAAGLPEGLPLAFGEPAEGLEGWRLTHRQALAALPIARLARQSIVRYADVAVVSTALRDEVLVESLHQLYIAPLSEEDNGRSPLVSTLRGYFQSDRNVSSTAAMLGISRQTVTAHLRTVEERLQRPLSSCAVELDLALRLFPRSSLRQVSLPH